MVCNLNLSPYSMVALVGAIIGVSPQDMAKTGLDEPGSSKTAAAVDAVTHCP